MEKKDMLFTPFKIGSCEIKNRIVMAPMGGTWLVARGMFNPNAAAYYAERAKGGAGMIMTGITFLTDIGGHKTWFHDNYDVFVPGAKKMMEEIHKYGSKLFLQLGAGFGRALPVDSHMVMSASPDPANAYISASEVPNVFNPEMMHRPMSKEEIQEMITAYAKCAKMAKDSDIDGVEVHAVHEGYILDQFACECTNGRTDEYGGSLENRLRFACEVVKAIKELCGEDYPVTIRYSVTSKMKGFNSGAMPGEAYKEFGRGMDESPRVAQILEEAGYDCLNADNGSYDSWYWAHPPVYMHKACNLPEVAYIKNFVNIPVMCAGRMEDVEIASDAIYSGKIDGVVIGRQLIADPEYPNKVQEGNYEDIRPCVACHHGCMGLPLAGQRMSCAVNPVAGYENERILKPVENEKHIVIIGGGVAGMEAARVARIRGHKVTLVEKTGRLGGVYNAAAAPFYKENDRRLIVWYGKELEKLGVDVKLNTEATPDMVKALNPDEIFLATGSTARSLPVKGIDKSNVVFATEYLYGEKEVGENVVVIGGGITGCEIGYELAHEGKKATIVEMKSEILDVPNLSYANSDMLRELLIYNKVGVVVNAKLAEITDEGIIFEQLPYVTPNPKLGKYRANFLTFEEGMHELKADTIIICAGYQSYVPTKDAYEGIAPVTVIGDSNKIGNLLSSVHDGFLAAFNI